MEIPAPCPVRLSGRLDPPVSRALWLVKWLLVVPHAFVLLFLWTAAFVLTVVAWFAILVTGRYPRAIFDFNVGVLRWTWRVTFYAYGALATDRYPPFTLADVPDYPAHLDIAYPERLSRGLVLVKSWLLAIPHFLVLGLFFGAGPVNSSPDPTPWPWSVGLSGLLVLFAAIALLFRGRYPRSVFDLVMGLNRWGTRVGAYVLLMTDVYPPFRLDQGEQEPWEAPEPSGPAPAAATTTASSQPAGWTALRIAGAAAGSVVVVLGLVLGAAGGGALFVDRQLRDHDGFLMSSGQRFDTPSYAIVTDDVRLHQGSAVNAMLGKVRLTVSGSDVPYFLGIAPTARVDRYLADVRHSELSDIRDGVPIYREVAGATPPGPPAAQTWEASVSGTETRTLTWEPQTGDWTIVLMNADGSAGVSAEVAAGATLPVLGWSAAALLIGAGVLLLGGIALLLVSLPQPPGPTADQVRTGPPLRSGAVR